LHVYRDLAESQDWHYCRGCETCGDMIELAAAAWKLDIPGTVRKLHTLGVLPDPEVMLPENIQEYVKQHVVFRKQMRKVWQDAAAYAANEQGIAQQLMHQLRLPKVEHKWENRGGRLIGLIKREDIFQQIVRKGDHAYRTDRKEKEERNFCIPKGALAGHGWDNALVIPHSDLPGRICGFMLLGFDKQGEQQPIYLPVEAPGHNLGNKDAGVGFIEHTLLPAHRLFNRTIFAFADPLMMLRAQIMHLRESEQPLPIVTSFYGQIASTGKLWQMLGCEKVIYWSPQAPGIGLVGAKEASGQFADTTTDQRIIREALQREGPQSLLRMIQLNAAPWQTALRHKLESLNRFQVEELLARMELTNEQFTTFATTCSLELRERLQNIRDHAGVLRQVRFRRHTVHEQNDTWTYDKGELISNAIVRIQRVITSRRGRTYYSGTIRFRGSEFTFLEQCKTVEKQGFEWLSDYIRDHCRAGTISYCPEWRSTLARLAILFHEPDQVQSAETVGWDRERQTFQFADFAISPNGQVSTDEPCLLSGDHLPARHLKPPEGYLARRLVRKLWDKNDEVKIVWATMACVAANLLAPLVNAPYRGTLLDGEGAASLGAAAARLMGCPEIVWAGGDSCEAVIRGRLDPHTWPGVLRTPSDKWVPTGQWLQSAEAGRVLVALSPIANQVLGLRRTWHIIRCARPLGSLQLTNEAVPYLIPYYLQDLLQRGLQRGSQAITASPLTILEDIAEWFKRQAGPALVVREARDILEPAGETEPHRFFIRLVAYALNLGGVRLGHEEAGDDTQVLYLADNASVWIGQNAISDTAYKYGSLPLDVLLVTQLLEKAGVLREENRRNGFLGWQINREWWDSCWRSLAKLEQFA
jgi:hypothetical protein